LDLNHKGIKQKFANLVQIGTIGLMLDLAVVIVSHNTKQLLEDCLDSVCAAEQPAGGLQLIVVDNASNDGTVEMLRQKFGAVHLISNHDNRGFSAANNQGAAVADSRYLLFLNSDTRVRPDALVKPLCYMQANPKVGALTAKLVYPNGQRDPDNHRGFPTPWTSFCHFSGLDRLFPNSPRLNGYYQSYLDFDQVHRIEVAAGSYLMMPTSLFRQLGGWDETFFFYGEDIDLCYRINEAGYPIIYYPEVEVIHYKGASSGLRKESAGVTKASKETRMKVAAESARAMNIFYDKHYRRRYPGVVSAAVLTAIRLMGWLRMARHRLS
jgi:GT2 family glycosyltransferase